MRPLVAALFVALATAAPAAAGELLTVKHPIPGSYLVKFKPDAVRASFEPRSQRPLVATAARQLARAHGGKVTSVWQHALKGFAVRLAPKHAAALAADPRVAYVEPNQVGHVLGTQTGAWWGLDRIDQRDLPLNDTYNYNQTGRFCWGCIGGAQGVHVYVIDTGVRSGGHQEFEGRLGNGYASAGDGQDWYRDCHPFGHGTHVAGVIGGTVYGVAKQVTLHVVRAGWCDPPGNPPSPPENGEITAEAAIDGVNWVTSNHLAPAVVNMSVAVGPSGLLDTAVRNSIATGVTYVVGAGNENINACDSSPGRVAEAITVAATARSDARASYSAYGSCVDIFAPGGEAGVGQGISAACPESYTAICEQYGTSQAAPHVTGAVALYLQLEPGARPVDPNGSPLAVTQAILGSASTGKVTNPGPDSPNRLLYSLFRGDRIGVRRDGKRFLLNNDFDWGPEDINFGYGSPGQEVLVGDWNGDGIDTMGIRVGNSFSLNNQFDGGPNDILFDYGYPGDEIVVGDWNGDGIDTVGRRQGNYFYLNNDFGGPDDIIFGFGNPGEEVVVGDWNGDGIDTLGVRQPAGGNTYYLNNRFDWGGIDWIFFGYGNPGDEVMSGDWNADGMDTLGVRQPVGGNTFYLNNRFDWGGIDWVVFGYGNLGEEFVVGQWVAGAPNP